MRWVLGPLLVVMALGGCATGHRMPAACLLDPTFKVVEGQERRALLDELALANAAASIDNFDFKATEQYVSRFADRAVVCQISSCLPAWWSFERVDGKWITLSHFPAVCVVR